MIEQRIRVVPSIDRTPEACKRRRTWPRGADRCAHLDPQRRRTGTAVIKKSERALAGVLDFALRVGFVEHQRRRLVFLVPEHNRANRGLVCNRLPTDVDRMIGYRRFLFWRGRFSGRLASAGLLSGVWAAIRAAWPKDNRKTTPAYLHTFFIRHPCQEKFERLRRVSAQRFRWAGAASQRVSMLLLRRRRYAKRSCQSNCRPTRQSTEISPRAPATFTHICRDFVPHSLGMEVASVLA